MKHEFSKEVSPKAARLIDINKCEVSFDNLQALIDAFNAIDNYSYFRVCNIYNAMYSFEHDKTKFGKVASIDSALNSSFVYFFLFFCLIYFFCIALCILNQSIYDSKLNVQK